MSDVIRGGQVTFHKFRMFMQVSKVMTRIGLLLILLSMGYSFYRDITPKEWIVGAALIKKDLILPFNENCKITYQAEYFRRTVNVSELEQDPYVRKIIKKFEKTFYKSLVTASIMLGIVLGGMMLFFWVKGISIKRRKDIRGIFLSSEQKLKWEIYKHNTKFEGYKPFRIADFIYPITGRKESWTSGEQSHTLIVASTGAGKTRIIQELVYQLHKRRQKAIIVDIKGEYIERFYRNGDIILNPLDKRGRNWTIFNETTPLKGFLTIAKSLIPATSKNDPIWNDAARSVLAEMANLYVSEGLSLSQFADKILKPELDVLVKLLKATAASKIINDDIEKAALSVLMVLSTYLRPLKLYRSADNCFSITDWVNDNSQSNFLFISSRPDAKEDINPLVAAQVDIAINALRSLKDASNEPKVWFILDELPYFDHGIPSLQDGLATVRSFGGCFVLGTQDMNSLARIYSHESAKTIANNCRTKLFLNVDGKETAEWCSQSLGEGEIEEWHEGLSYGSHEMRDGVSVNRSRGLKRVVIPSELMMLKAGEGFIKFSGFAPAKFRFDDCYLKKIAASYQENTELFAQFKRELQEGEENRKKVEEELKQQFSNYKNSTKVSDKGETNANRKKESGQRTNIKPQKAEPSNDSINLKTVEIENDW